MGAEHEDDLQGYLENVAPHVDVGAAMPYDHVLIQGVEGEEGSAHGQDLQQGHGVDPFGADGDEDELARHEHQAEHGGEGEERREPHHLAEDAQLALALIGNRRKDGLRHLLRGVGNERIGHEIPLVGLAVVAQYVLVEELADDNRHDVVVHGVHHHDHEDVHAEAKHLAYGPEVDVERGPPWHVIVAPHVEDGDVEHLLPRQAPIAIAQEGERYAGKPREDQGERIDHGHLLHHEFLGEVGVGRDAEAAHDERQKDEMRQGREHRLVEEVGDERRREPQDGVEREAHEDVEPEHRVEVLVLGVLHVDEVGAEPRALQVARYGREDGDVSDDAILARRQQPSQHDADEQVEHLCGSAIERPPEEALGGFLFECVCHRWVFVIAPTRRCSPACR